MRSTIFSIWRSHYLKRRILLVCGAGICCIGWYACTKVDIQREGKEQPGYEARAKQLYALGNHFLDEGNDSVQVIAHQLIALGEAHEDTAIIVKGKLLKVNDAWRSSNYKEAMTLALDALSDAQKNHLKNDIPGIYAIIGNLYKENENYPSAIATAQRALAAARENNDTAQLIRATLNLGMFTHSYGMQKNDTALQRKALPIYLDGMRLAESGPAYEISRIPFYDDLSQYYKMEGDYAKGIEYADRGVELALKYNQWNSLTYSYNWLGEIYFYQGNHEKGFAYLHKALQTAQNIHNAYREMEINEAFYECYHSIGDDKNALKYFYRSVQIKDSLQVEQNVKDIGQLHIQYETGRKDAEIAALGALNKERERRNLYVLSGLLVFFGLSIFLFFQGKGIRHRNRLLTAKNKTIEEQAEQLKLLMKELHHRVKNNLQIVSSLLSLQSNHLSDHDAQQAIKVGQQRIEAMSLIHRSLYHQDNPNMVNMQEYVSNLVGSILQSFGIAEDNFDLHLDVEVKELDVDMALPLGLIINEWVTNTFKHAYKNIKYPALHLALKKNSGVELSIRDNGPGLSREVWEKPRGSFGIKLVKILSKQLNGVCEMKNEQGTQLKLLIPEKTKRA